MQKQRLTVADITAHKNQAPLVCVTAYTAPYAQLFDRYADVILVGDTLGMVVYGMDSTVGVSLDMMINHGKAVVKSSTNAFIVVDLPYGSYQRSKEQAYDTAVTLLRKTGAQAVKLEGGAVMAETVEFLTKRGIAVMGHIGLMPQYSGNHSRYQVKGQESAEKQHIINDAKALEQAGAFALVLECIPEKLAATITKKVTIPTIGIGASSTCDGQVLVADDLLGTFERFRPKFVKQYTNLAEHAEQAIQAYAKEVRERSFPSAEHCY